MRDGVQDGSTFAQARPQDAGFHASRLARLDEDLRSATRRGDIAGVNALVVRKGIPAYAACIGQRSLAANTPMRPDTIFRIYSMSKPVVSVAVMLLLERGKLLLNDPVRQYLPELGAMRVHAPDGALVAQQPEMTIADLMGHTAGLSYGGDPADPVDRLWDAARLFRREGTIQDVTARLAELPLRYQPGSQFQYSIAHDVLGALIERVSGERLGEFLAANIFQPLGMTDTAFAVPHDKLGRLATLYGPTTSGGLEVLDEAATQSRWHAPVSFEAGGEGLVSTVPDYLRFCEMLLGRGAAHGVQILSRKSVELMTANRLTDAQRAGFWMKGYGYGLGFGVLLDPAANANLGTPGEYTWAGSASTYFWIDPKEEIIALLFAQLEPSSHLTIARRFKALMYQALA